VRNHRDLKITVAAAVICAAGALAIPIEFLSLLFAAPLAFFLPGYAIASAALVRRRLDRPRMLVVSLGLSLVTLALGGLLLNYLGGLRAGSWALLLVLVVIAASRAAALRRPRGWTAARMTVGWRPPTALAGSLVLGGILAAVAAVALAFVPLSATHAIGFTELWMRPYATSAATGVSVGVSSQEQETTAYVLRARFGNEPVSTERSIELDPGETETIRIPAVPSASAEPLPVSVTLSRAETPDRTYRRVFGWIPEGPTG
jgi:uncharacterized membrane protein